MNLHQRGNEFDPKAGVPTPGPTDLCFITAVPMVEVMNHFVVCGVPVPRDTVQRTGAAGLIMSAYPRDPEMNLIEVSNRMEQEV
jgi:hypothetical protein